MIAKIAEDTLNRALKKLIRRFSRLWVAKEIEAEASTWGGDRIVRA